MTRFGRIRSVLAALGGVLLPAGDVLAQFPTTVMLEELDGANGFVVRGVEYNQFADTLAAIGDVNADGVVDLASGKSGLQWYPDCYCVETPGMAHVIFGHRGVGGGGLWTVDDLDATTGIHVPEIGFRTCHGNVSGAGDFNDDGIDDFLVSACCSSGGGWWYSGETYVIYGGRGVAGAGVFDVGALDGTNGFAMYGATAQMTLGARMAPAGDLNGDGVDDIMFGNVVATVDGKIHVGQVYVLWGGRGLGASGAFYMKDWTPEVGLIINGMHESGVAGYSLAPLGDFDGDGVDDFAVAVVWQQHTVTGADYGSLHVVFGRRMGDADLDLADIGPMQVCFHRLVEGDVPDECHPFDFDRDNDVDQADHAAFAAALTGPQ